MQFNEVLQYLIDNKYILASGGKYNLSKTFQEAAAKVKRDRENGMIVPMTVVPKAMAVEKDPANNYQLMSKATQQGMDWVKAFIGFINEAQVPARLESNRGEVYSVNKYSEDGMKAFRKALEGGIDYKLLVKSTMLYYKSSVRFKKAIGNYMAQGDWRSDYEALKVAALSGTTAIEQHLKQETKDNGHNPYRLG